ncbi:sensor histidine kinase [Actinomycetospora cinnamomea]|uniref:histidine kinase n=1 Tax=Actinomycetospora cinnamomea TaxID=663609 RepID=A0A2U1EUP1_9PSEU|nr:sensor histidine kinase [Actinomycetospora cinnamomea]PVZ03646.1 signal transduction histidine kinase [Actinomycetospora cinnamomea]
MPSGLTPMETGVGYVETLTTRAVAAPSVLGVIPAPRPSWWPRAGDVALAGALATASILGTALTARPDDRPWWPGGAALVVAAATALVWRHRAPVLVLAATLLTVAPYYWMGYPDGPASLMVAVAMYTVASRLSWPRSVGIGVVLFVVWVGLERVISFREVVVVPPDRDRFMWIIVTVAVGVAVGGLRRGQAEAAERAEEQARRRVGQERLRLAREVHDVVSHSLAMIAVQAGVGAHVADRRPEQAVAALLEIKEASRAALAELRTTLAVLREAESPDAPGLHRLDEVARVAGLAGVGVEVRGSAGELDPPVDGAAFRIVREAVTNTVRHARDARRVTVDLERDAGELRLRVTDDGGPTDPVSPGHGLRGLAEHAAAIGGRSSATPGPDGFVVEAALPLVSR